MNLRRPLLVITPTLDGDVLAVLARNQSGLTGGKIHRLVGHGSAEGVRKVLERLVRQGIVLREEAGRAYLYSLNREHLAASWIAGLATLGSQLIGQLRETIGGWEQQPRFAILFGSVARGEADEKSDIDILLIRSKDVDDEDATWRGQLVELERAATAWTGNDARVIEYGELELAELAGKEPVLDDAARDGIELLGSLRSFKQRLRGRT